MSGRTVTLPTADGPMDLYEAVPEGGTSAAQAAVIVVQEAFGVNEHIESVADRLAERGFHAVAPHFFHRAGGGTVDDVEALRRALEQAPVDHDVVRYADAGHGFNRDVSPDAYRPGPAADAWRRMLDWFAGHLK